MEPHTPDTVRIDEQPGHAIRRLHQISVGIFHQVAQDLGITPVQYAALQAVHNHPGSDQRTLARLIALDTSTTAGVIDRLEARGLLTRSTSAEDRRVRLLALTPSGRDLLQQTIPRMAQAQELILAPLTPRQRTEFLRLLQLLITENNELSRAPSDPGRVV
jgi:MarR family transcriptional regulator, lower aerobic nicotinate degradation pathway regulator